MQAVVRLFVNTFGITQPAPEAEAKAGRFIAWMLALVVAVLGLAAWVLHSVFTH
jgi:hypothetical protein